MEEYVQILTLSVTGTEHGDFASEDDEDKLPKRLLLVAEPDNEHDNEAVRYVDFTNASKKYGYIPMSCPYKGLVFRLLKGCTLTAKLVTPLQARIYIKAISKENR